MPRPNRRLTPNAHEQAALARGKALYAEGKSLREIAQVWATEYSPPSLDAKSINGSPSARIGLICTLREVRMFILCALGALALLGVASLETQLNSNGQRRKAEAARCLHQRQQEKRTRQSCPDQCVGAWKAVVLGPSASNSGPHAEQAGDHHCRDTQDIVRHCSNV